MRKRKKALTPSLPQHVRFPGWTIHEGTCKQRIFSTVNTCLQCYAFWWRKKNHIIIPVRKRKQKSWRVSNFALLFVVLKWHHGTFTGFSEWHAGKHGTESIKFTYCSCVIPTLLWVAVVSMDKYKQVKRLTITFEKTRRCCSAFIRQTIWPLFIL